MGSKTRRIEALEHTVKAMQMQIDMLPQRSIRIPAAARKPSSSIPQLAVRHPFIPKQKGHTHFWAFSDGDMVCAVLHDFVNLQESPSGFGYCVADACENLIKDMHSEKEMCGTSNAEEDELVHIMVMAGVIKNLDDEREPTPAESRRAEEFVTRVDMLWQKIDMKALENYDGSSGHVLLVREVIEQIVRAEGKNSALSNPKE